MLYFANLWFASLATIDLMCGFISLIVFFIYVLLQQLEDNIIPFGKNELKNLQKSASPDNSEGNECEDDRFLGCDDKQQKDSFLRGTLHFLRKMNQGKLADCLQSSKTIFQRFTPLNED